MAGFTEAIGNPNYNDVLLIKTDADGNITWYQTLGDTEFDHVYSVIQTFDGGYAAAGHTISYGVVTDQLYLLKTDSLGNELWHQTFGNGLTAKAYDIEQTADGGFFITGYISQPSALGTDVYLVRTDSLGGLLWERTIGGLVTDLYDYGFDAAITPEGGYVIAGKTISDEAQSYDGWILKTDSCGAQIWERKLGGRDYDWFHSVLVTSEGDYVFTGLTKSFNYPNDSDFYIVKTDGAGDTLWTRVYGNANWEEARGVVESVDGGYVFTGQSVETLSGMSDLVVFKVSADGDSVWSVSVGGDLYDMGWQIAGVDDGGYIVAGITSSFSSGGTDAWLVKFNSDLSVEGINTISSPSIFSLSNPFPNPFNSSVMLNFTLPQADNITISIYDITGREAAELYKGWHTTGDGSVVWSAERMPSGIYFAVMESDHSRQVRKMVLVK